MNTYDLQARITDFLQKLDFRSPEEDQPPNRESNQGWSGWFKHLLEPPQYERPEDARRARTLHIFLLLSLFFSNLFGLLVIPVSPIPATLLTLLILVDGLGVAAVIQLRRGHLCLAAGLYLGGIWGTLTYLATAIVGGVISPAVEGYLLVVLAAGLFMGSRYALLFALASGVAMTGTLYAGSHGMLLEPTILLTPEQNFGFQLLNFAMGVVLILAVSQGIQAALDRARLHEEDLEEKNRQLQDVLASLEQRIFERTGDILRQKQYFEALLDNSPIAIVTQDHEQRIQSCNPAFEQLFGYAQDEAIGVNLDGLIAPEECWDEATEYTRRVLQGETIKKTSQRRRKNGSLVDVDIYGVPVMVDGEQIGNLAMYQDITERIRAEEHLKHLATHDPLTMLPNRTLFYDHLGHALEVARRTETRLAVFFLDLDGFKAVNDLLGHAKGDQLLQQVAQRLRESRRKSDLVARLGGDEFAFVFENIHSPEDVAVIAEKVLTSLTQPLQVEGQELSISGSIGISLYPEDGGDARTLLRHADAAMYRVKGQGKQHYQFFSWRGKPE